jgi:hypothetical protein
VFGDEWLREISWDRENNRLEKNLFRNWEFFEVIKNWVRWNNRFRNEWLGKIDCRIKSEKFG